MSGRAGASFELRGWVLFTVKRAVTLSVLLVGAVAPRPALAETSPFTGERVADPVGPSEAALGWFGVSVGLAMPRLKTTLGSTAAEASSEGSVGSGGDYRLSYEKQLFFRCLSLRGFVRSTDWGTELSQYSGDGDRSLYDLGAAPVLSYAAVTRRPHSRGHGLSLFAFVPVSFTWSLAPARAKREVVIETMDVGTGYRVGLGFGMLVELSPTFGLFLEFEASKQHVEHVRRYRRADGTGRETRLPIAYDLGWLGVELGLAIFP